MRIGEDDAGDRVGGALAADELALDQGDVRACGGQRARAVLAGRATADDDDVLVTDALIARLRLPARDIQPRIADGLLRVRPW